MKEHPFSYMRHVAATGSAIAFLLMCAFTVSLTNGASRAAASTIPVAPSSIHATCAADGHSVTLSWSTSSGATGYFPRLNSQAYSSVSACPVGLQTFAMGSNGFNTCYTDNTSATSMTVPVTPGQSYGAWVYAGNSAGVDWTAYASTGTFSCAAQQTAGPAITDLSLNGTNGDLTVSEGTPVNITWDSTNTSLCSINYNGTQYVGSNSSAPLSVNTSGAVGSYTYTLTCSGTNGATVTASRTLTTTNSATNPTQSCPTGTTGTYPNCSVTQTSSTGATVGQCSNAVAQRGDTGQSFTCTCSAGVNTGTSIWGTGPYSDDSNICTAAVQSGVITASQGGSVTYTVQGAQTSFSSGTVNGVTSYAYGSWPGSYTISGASSQSITNSNTTTPAPTVNVTANPSTLSYGEDTTITWSSTNAQSCTSNQFATAGATHGSVQMPYQTSATGMSQPTTYRVTCTGAGGTSSSFANVSQNLQTSVTSGPPSNPNTPYIATFSIEPATAGGTWPIKTNTPFAVVWTTSGMTSCSVNLPSGVSAAGSLSGTSLVGARDYETASAGTYPLQLQCTGTDGKAYAATAAVTVVAPAAQTCPQYTTGTYPNCTTQPSITYVQGLSYYPGMTGSSNPVTVGTGGVAFAPDLFIVYPRPASGNYVIDFGTGYTFGGSNQVLTCAGGPINAFGTCIAVVPFITTINTTVPKPTASMTTSTSYTPTLHLVPFGSNYTVAQAIANTSAVATAPKITYVTTPRIYLTANPAAGTDSVTVTFSSWIPSTAVGGPYTLLFSGGNVQSCSVGEGCVPAPTCTPDASGVCQTPATVTHTYTWKNLSGDYRSTDTYLARIDSADLKTIVGEARIMVSCTPGKNGLCTPNGTWNGGQTETQSQTQGAQTTGQTNSGTTQTQSNSQTSSTVQSTHTSRLTAVQIQTILGVLSAFGVDPATIQNVQAALGGNHS